MATQRPTPINYEPQIPSTLNGPIEHIFIPPGARGRLVTNGMAAPSGHSTIHSCPCGCVQTQINMGPQFTLPHFNMNQPGMTGPGVQRTGGNIIINNHPGGPSFQMPLPGQYDHVLPVPGTYCGTRSNLNASPSVQYTGGGQRVLLPTGNPTWNGQQWVTYGMTNEEHLLDMRRRNDNRPQEMVPADPDISRKYEVQELDGNWTRRTRFTIDSGDIGQVRWFQRPNGTFFAKRLRMG